MSDISEDETVNETAQEARADGEHARATPSGNSFLSDFWVNFVRWNLKAVRNPFVVVGSLVQPIIFLVLFTQVFGQIATSALGGGAGDITYETFLLPAIAMQVSLAAAAGSGIGLVNDMEEGMFEKTLVMPMSRSAMFLGKTAAEILRIVVQIAIILALGAVLGANVATGFLGALGILGVGILFSLWFVALSNIMAIVTRDQESTIIGANLLQFPLLFVSTAFLPLNAMPDWIQVVATYNPITYGVDAARALMLDQDVMTVVEVTRFGGIWDTLVPAIAVLLALDLALGGAMVYLLNRASSSAVQ
ncbi:ABC-2 type transport system permease protein [Halorubrum trapanicum]|uniref:ABC-2 type transport system permease protein n=1 Tax=Halorubrum trapanicum TaxID=29284 RepID=A0A8J7RD79_9EURY|nr:ABC transporter permease [Halorubrum trapanicum]MBP1901871.1 ABC-2 type transport system permease protein [Halorubrum trapanicum]